MSLLTMEGIRKSFGPVSVLKDVRLMIEKGEVHALMGENGAGKSTLMNVLTGVHQRDAGTIVFDGEEFHNVTIKYTEEKGIAFVHQELNLFNDLKVFENIFLGKEYVNKFGKLDKKRMIAESRKLFEELGVDIDPDAVVSDLRTSQKQLLEISKALFFKAKLLILDEPTTSLNNDEVDHLFGIIRNLKAQGTSFIFISHKMPEIFEISDRYTVFRNGTYIGEGKITETPPEKITQMKVGEGYSKSDAYQPRPVGEEILSLKDYSGDGFSHIDLSVKKGQVIGFTGLQGSGSSELMQSMFGFTPATGGTMHFKGRDLTHHSIHQAMQAGIGLLAANRKENSVIPDMTILENEYIAEHTLSAAKLPINKRAEEEKYQGYKALLNIKAASSSDSILSLSGGNQQKVFIGRWLNTGAALLLFDHPTQGLAVGAKAEIYKLIMKLAEEGKTIIINTLEIPEIQQVADFCVIFYNGSIIKILEHDEIEETKVMLYSTNAVNAGK